MSAAGVEAGDPDPLYDAHYLIFIYAFWLLVASAFGNLAGLAALVAATAVLTVAAVTRHRRPEFRSFAAEFGSILLFSTAGIAMAVLLVNAISSAPYLMVGMGALVTAVAILGRLAWTERRTHRADTPATT